VFKEMQVRSLLRNLWNIPGYFQTTLGILLAFIQVGTNSVADLDPYHCSGSGSAPGCLGSGFVSYSNGTTKLLGRENLTKNTFCVGPVRPTDKENQVKMYKKYCFRYITSLKR
jgi:hypothetical protein